MNIRRLKWSQLGVAFAFVASMIIAQFSMVNLAHAAGDTITWDGGGSDSNFSTAENWVGDVAPVDGDIIRFVPADSGTDYQNIYLINDLTGVAFAGLVSVADDTGFSTFFNIDTITFKDAATITREGTGDKVGYVNFKKQGDTQSTATVIGEGDLSVGVGVENLLGVLDIAGNLSSAGGAVILSDGSNIAGNLSIISGTLIGSTVGGSITLPDSNNGLVIKGDTATTASNLAIGSTSGIVNNQLAFGDCATPPTGGTASDLLEVICGTYKDSTFTLSGTITLNADLVIHVASKSTVKLTGTINYNGHTITKEPSSPGVLMIGSDTVEVPTKTTSLAGDQSSTSATVVNKETATLSGTRSNISVNTGGTLKGTGTTNSLFNNGTVAPGNSPGKLTILSSYTGSGELSMELLNKDTYDQLSVGQDYTGGGNAVTLSTGAKLTTILYSGWSINKNDQFRIIDNLSSTAVSGTFDGLAEGAQFTVGNVTFSITYVGGDGNDVVLTALNTGNDPNAPNTGINSIRLSNPAIVAGLGLMTIVVLIVARRKLFNN